MTIHVFVGAGPANLHRALKIRRMDPDAKIVIVDKRLRPDSRDIDRVQARANIFRFENEVVTERLIADGVDSEALAPLTYDRDFSVPQGFQHHDDRVFSDKRFTQIQIRDLQLLLLQTLDRLGEPPLLLNQNVSTDSYAATKEGVLHLLEEHAAELGDLGAGELDIKIHAATGGLRDDDKKDSIVYPDKATQYMGETSPDVEAMPLVPTHGTTTFFIKDPETGASLLSCEQLEAAQRSLDATEWRKTLADYGWNLVRPPRIRVFYANDVLYIGAEIPVAMEEHSMQPRDYEHIVTEYTRAIAGLVFPSLRDQIAELPVNTYLRSRFATARGERGQVLTTTPPETVAWEAAERPVNIQIFNHGDSRYLPHYQTGSGFVTAFLQNEAYAEIYGQKTFSDLFAWAKEHGIIQDRVDESEVRLQYVRLISQSDDDITDEKILRVFKDELFMARSRDIIDENKEKVGRYFNALHSQALENLPSRFDDFLASYNKHQKCHIKKEELAGLDQRVVILQMLKTNNTGFLHEVLPWLLNKDFSHVDDKKILHIRDMHLLDLERNLPEIEQLEEVRKESTERLLTPRLVQTSPILAMEHEQLQDVIAKIADDFATNKALHHRANIFAFFIKGVHSDTIHAFVKELRAIHASSMPSPEDSPEHIRQHARQREEQLKYRFIEAVQKFQDKLEAGHSRRTLAELHKVMEAEFPTPSLRNIVL
ncbi:hypothetical protein [Legionella oakridgensis]|uniref:Uncharacterized protein n=2 Tax=Legionella oakridgensis TaxID=29423 RepID=W0B783_9GAMM|nr:hypothetical protein [Legionella oakridgensis]AHE65725.1 hypothetical protein Loa_00134 [Legionella oakridgensis ATCC 33761 = DSM 21215]ETO94449.1 hypothetical protein LOR_49c09670 [Legionella oakridgensis RV-2-2007]KTD38200.1 hypothetical protein Loak_1876 [Legionella oakridgensis]STY15670.1 Uncharacterised protein [Legionella longbeachae]